MSNSKQKEIFVLILCLLLGFALRFYTFDQKSLWMDEIHTFNDSRDDLRGQLNFYEKNPTYLHPPLFFVLTHLFYPFTKPERDLRIIPLIFGTLSIPMIYSLSRLFSPIITIPCSLSLTFMAYHISLSQDGRSFSLLMFIGLTGLYFFMRHLQTSKKRDLALVAFFFSLLFYTSYSSIPFIAVSQILWFYRTNEEVKKTQSFLFFDLKWSHSTFLPSLDSLYVDKLQWATYDAFRSYRKPWFLFENYVRCNSKLGSSCTSQDSFRDPVNRLSYYLKILEKCLNTLDCFYPSYWGALSFL